MRTMILISTLTFASLPPRAAEAQPQPALAEKQATNFFAKPGKQPGSTRFRQRPLWIKPSWQQGQIPKASTPQNSAGQNASSQPKLPSVPMFLPKPAFPRPLGNQPQAAIPMVPQQQALRGEGPQALPWQGIRAGVEAYRRNPELFAPRDDDGPLGDADWTGPLPWRPGQPAPQGNRPQDQVGPSAWDWVAIGISSAALWQALANQAHQGNGAVLGPPVVVERPVIVERVVESTSVPAKHEPGKLLPEEDLAAELPTIRAGEFFEMPIRGVAGEAGRIAVKIGPVFFECTVEHWDATRIVAFMPSLLLEAATPGELFVALADGTPLARVAVRIVPADLESARNPASTSPRRP